MENNVIKMILILAAIMLNACSHHHKHKDMNKKFLDPSLDVNKYIKSFENENRDVYQNRHNILNSLNIQKGDYVADIGAGTGAFLNGLNQKVGPNGKVYAVEISERFVELMSKRATEENLKSVEVVQGKLNSTMLETSSVNIALLIDVYHHLDEPGKMLSDFKRILKKGGTLAIVDFDKVPGVSRKWIINHLRLEKSGYIEEITKAGFTFIGEKKVPLKENFVLLFKKI